MSELNFRQLTVEDIKNLFEESGETLGDKAVYIDYNLNISESNDWGGEDGKDYWISARNDATDAEMFETAAEAIQNEKEVYLRLYNLDEDANVRAYGYLRTLDIYDNNTKIYFRANIENNVYLDIMLKRVCYDGSTQCEYFTNVEAIEVKVEDKDDDLGNNLLIETVDVFYDSEEDSYGLTYKDGEIEDLYNKINDFYRANENAYIILKVTNDNGSLYWGNGEKYALMTNTLKVNDSLWDYYFYNNVQDKEFEIVIKAHSQYGGTIEYEATFHSIGQGSHLTIPIYPPAFQTEDGQLVDFEEDKIVLRWDEDHQVVSWFDIDKNDWVPEQERILPS